MQYEAEEMKQFKSLPTAKEIREMKARSDARLKHEQEAAMKIDVVVRFVLSCDIEAI